MAPACARDRSARTVGPAFPEPADAAVCDGPLDPAARTTPVDETSDGWGPITISAVVRVADAHTVVPCVDVAVDHEISTGSRTVADAATLGDGGTVLGWAGTDEVFDGDQFVGPSTLRALAPDDGRLTTADLAASGRVDDRWAYGLGLVRQGNRAAWFETPNTQIAGTLPWALRLLDDDGSVVTVSDSTALQVAEADAVALSDEVVWWTTALTNPAQGCRKTLHAAAFSDLSLPLADLRVRVCAVGFAPDGAVVAYEEGTGGPGIGAGNGTSTVFELISSPGETSRTTTLLSINNGLLDYEAVAAVAYDDGRLAFATGNLIYVVDLPNRTGYQVRGDSPADALDVSGESVAWSSSEGPVHVLTGVDGSLSLFTLPGEQVSVGVEGDRIAWAALDDAGAFTTYGRLRW